jgi:hypothetical protein
VKYYNRLCVIAMISVVTTGGNRRLVWSACRSAIV